MNLFEKTHSWGGKKKSDESSHPIKKGALIISVTLLPTHYLNEHYID